MKKNFLRPAYFAVLLGLTALIFIIEAFTAKSLDYVFSFVGYGGTFAHHDLRILGLKAYWALMLLGYVICLHTCVGKREKYALGKWEAVAVATGFLVVSFIGGKLLYVLEHLSTIRKLEFGGLSLFGAIFVVPVVAWAVCRFTKWKFKPILDLCAQQGLVILACVRIGCFISGCCGATKFWVGERPIILPVQLMEAAVDLLILEKCLQTEKKQQGLMYPVLMIGYGAVRFLLELFRTSSKIWWQFSVSHIFALLSVAVGILLYRRLSCKK